MTKQNNPDERGRMNETTPARDGTDIFGSTALETALERLSPVARDEWGIAVAVNESERYATLDLEIPSGLPMSQSARARIEDMRARRIEYTDHTDREYEKFFDFPATEWTWASPFVHAVRDARRRAHWELTQELRRVALDYLAGTAREGSADADAVRLLRRMMLRDEA